MDCGTPGNNEMQAPVALRTAVFRDLAFDIELELGSWSRTGSTHTTTHLIPVRACTSGPPQGRRAPHADHAPTIRTKSSMTDLDENPLWPYSAVSARCPSPRMRRMLRVSARLHLKYYPYTQDIADRWNDCRFNQLKVEYGV
ncbi:hypothetical protein SCLCIDRAFT_1212098 [Scleroderma citrinum Foug A]|uniref:Uncharacterized protein n=1 Tax=Scleroderma citrinum Foug A TaxID=1036808 RepID=A0A0C3ECM6_9AGAM|nr:hypothetical protein SCLCIDRAFT_1212098 [Scleroderma citrinum Foug A]